MYVAVPIPPLRLFRLGGESRYDALGLFLHLLLHFGLSRKAFLSETLAGKAVMARTLPLRIVHATDNKRPPFVRPTERYRSSSSISSKFRSTGSLFSNCSNSVGATLWASRCFLFSSIRFRWPPSHIVSQRIYVEDWLRSAGCRARSQCKAAGAAYFELDLREECRFFEYIQRRIKQ